MPALRGVDQALAPAGQLQGLALGAGKQDYEVIRDSQTPLEDGPSRRVSRNSNLGRLDHPRQAGGVIRPADLVGPERRWLLRLRLVRLHFDL